MPDSAMAASVRARAQVPSGPVLVALSGGADSAVLAWLLSVSHQPVRALFVDHALEGSLMLQAAAISIADHLGMKFDSVPAPIGRDEPSFEDAARAARYEALQAAAKPDEVIVTGHTADDQAETVLGHFLRGAGAAGLAGIPARRGRIARPLLAIARQETRALARELGLPFVDDPQNQSFRLRRNRLRHELIPHLEESYNPQLRSALRRTAALMAADDDALEGLAARVPFVLDGEAVAIPSTLLGVLNEAVATRVVRRAVREIRGPHAGSHHEVTAVLEVAGRRRRGAELSGGIRVEREGPMVVLSSQPPIPLEAVPVEVPAVLSFDRWRLALTLAGETPRPRPLGSCVLVLDAALTGSILTVRPPVSGDRIGIATGSKPVADAMAEAGVPRRLRLRWPVLIAEEKVAAIPGARVADWAAPRPTTARYLVARMTSLGG